MRAFTGYPDEQKCELYNIDGRFFSGQDESQIAGRPTLGGGDSKSLAATAAPRAQLDRSTRPCINQQTRYTRYQTMTGDIVAILKEPMVALSCTCKPPRTHSHVRIVRDLMLTAAMASAEPNVTHYQLQKDCQKLAAETFSRETANDEDRVDYRAHYNARLNKCFYAET